jgi:hypothetical protein
MREFIKVNSLIVLVFIMVIAFPAFINYVLLTWHFPGVYENTDAWLGFLANYSGGIMGGLVALLIARYQFSKDKEDKVEQENEQREYALALIENFIFQEMRNNLKEISKESWEALKTRANSGSSSYYINISFKYKTYEDLKYELVRNLKVKKGESNTLITDLTEFYEYLMILEKTKNIDSLKPYVAFSMYESFYAWSVTLDSV